jgi:hypothetical protein
LIFSYFIRLTVQFRSAVVDTSAGQAADWNIYAPVGRLNCYSRHAVYFQIFAN